MTIDGRQLDLLLRLLEARELVYTHGALVDYHGPAGQALIDAGLMVPDGFDRFVTADDEDDSPVMEVETDPVHGLGYHSPYRGWVKIDRVRLQRYRPALERVFEMLLGDELRPPPRGPQDLDGGLAWEIGEMRLTRGPISSLWFARRLGDRDVLQRVRAAAERRPSPKLRLLLTSTPHQRLPAETLPMTKIVPIADVLSSDEPATIDAGILKARFAGQTQETVTAPLHLSEDGRTLTIQGSKRISFRSSGQIKVIRALVDAYRQGKRLNASQTLHDAGLGARTFKQAFGDKWEDLRPHLISHNQLWGFEV